MALEPGAGLISGSPSSSGRASPISKQWGAQRGEEDSYAKDKAFRRYASSVERSLSLFDTALEEWADYISFIGRLLKSLQSHPPNIPVVPSKALVSRRLAQCLNPTLPSGVHQKALEVYNYIFSMIGPDALSRDLPLYLPGLSPTLSFASLTVRSPFLSLLESHFLKLDPQALRPALKAIILSLLPGLEEETSEEFDRTLKLLNGFRSAVRAPSKEVGEPDQSAGDEFFWQCFFLASITSQNRRLGALAYLIRFLPKLASSERRGSLNGNGVDDINAALDDVADVVTSPEPGLLIRCFAAGLADEQLLIQRGFLDLLVTHLPLHAPVLQKRVKRHDLELLLAAASGVVARRDMSLNRRLWAWLLGPEPLSSSDGDGTESPSSITADPMNNLAASKTRYFEEFGLQSLTTAILKMISSDYSKPGDRAKPFRICLSLMDRWEIGGLVVPEIFLPVVSSVRSYQSKAPSKADFSEVLRSASMFFDGVESGLIWGEIVGLVIDAVGPGHLSLDERISKISLVRFILANFNVREEEMLIIHAPLTALILLSMLENPGVREASDSRPDKEYSNNITWLSLNLATDLFELIPERAFATKTSTEASSQPQLLEISNSDIRDKIRSFYVQEQGNIDLSPPPFSANEISELLHRESIRIFNQSLERSVVKPDISLGTRIFVSLLLKSPRIPGLDIESLLVSIHTRLATPNTLSFAAFTNLISLVTTLHPQYLSSEDVSGLVEPLVRLAWRYLAASQPKYHVETVRALWQLQTSLSLDNHEIEAAICIIITEHDVHGTFANRSADAGRSFSILWTHTLQDNSTYLDRRPSKSTNLEVKVPGSSSIPRDYEVMLSRPLFLLLDALLDERTQLFVTIRTWIQSLTGVDKLFHLILSKLTTFRFLHTSSQNEKSSDGQEFPYTEDDDVDQCLYYLQKIASIFRWSSDATWSALAKHTISKDGSLKVFLPENQEEDESLQILLIHICLRTIRGIGSKQEGLADLRINQLHRTALSVLHQILISPYSSSISEMHLEDQLIERLQASLDGPDPLIQISLLDVVFAALKLRHAAISKNRPASGVQHRRVSSQDASNESNSSLTLPLVPQSTPPIALVKCLQAGFMATSSRPVLDSWMSFLSECLPFYSDNIFQILIPLVETLCDQIAQTFAGFQKMFKDAANSENESLAPESTLISLLNGLEQVLARGHERLLKDEAKIPAIKSPDQTQGFFGNMVSGVFSSDAHQTRTQSANNRLTVLLSFQDAVRMCFMIWSWGGRGLGGSGQDTESIASFGYTSLRLRNRARRLLEHLFAAETLECLETVVETWQKAARGTEHTKYTAVFNLLHVLDGSRPKHTIPAIFDALYSRTNPNALDASRKSTLTSNLLDTDLVIFLVEYARSLEDDAMDEIWTDCMTFLKDILANPFPHRQTLSGLLEFAAILGEKVDNTNFGEQRKMRRELGDLFLRLLTATFTTKPIGFSDGATQQVGGEKSSDQDDAIPSSITSRSEDVVGILASIAPKLPQILVEPDRILNAATIISTSVVGPTIRSRAYPENISRNLLILIYQLSRLPNTQKIWKKDLADAFIDPRFFANSLTFVEIEWLPLLRQWALGDKDRMPDLLSRISAPTTAGIVFGVGATSARLEADRRTQLNLRRVATLILASADDSYVAELSSIEGKLVELLTATTTSSPSSTTRAEVYLVLRSLILKTSPIHLAFLWPTVNAELYAALSSVIAPDHSQTSETYNNYSILQACKLLDTLLCVAPEDFQLHEWLFITDTIDAVYRPSDYAPVALVEELSEELGSTNITSASLTENNISLARGFDKSNRRPLLGPGGIDCDAVNLERKDDLVGKVLRPFFGQLSIFAFESTYDMGKTDWEALRKSLLVDMFDERGIVKAL